MIFSITSAVAFFLLTETNPRLSGTPDVGTRVYEVLRRISAKCIRMWRTSEYVEYTTVNGDDGRLPTSYRRSTSGTEGHSDEVELSPSGQPSAAIDSAFSLDFKEKRYTVQVILQILSVSLLAFHKVASDTLIPVFLASPPSMGDVPKLWIRFPFDLAGGFGLSSASVGNVLLTQATIAILVQFFVVPRIVTRFGALRTYRWTLSVFPFLYCMTPFVVKLHSPFSLIALLVDLWIKVLLVGLGYVCSAIL